MIFSAECSMDAGYLQLFFYYSLLLIIHATGGIVDISFTLQCTYITNQILIEVIVRSITWAVTAYSWRECNTL
jgi:hypothetical protein